MCSILWKLHKQEFHCTLNHKVLYHALKQKPNEIYEKHYGLATRRADKSSLTFIQSL